MRTFDDLLNGLETLAREALQSLMQNRDDGSYNHVPPKPAFTVQATYKFIGKLKPRRFPLDE